MGSAGGGCPPLVPPCFLQLHIVHINVKYRTLAEAKGHPNGLAVLGFFFQVGLRGLLLPTVGDPPGTGCSWCGWGLCSAPTAYSPPPQVSETPNTNYNTIVAGLRNISHAGESPSHRGRDRKRRAGGQGCAWRVGLGGTCWSTGPSGCGETDGGGPAFPPVPHHGMG